MDRMDLFGFSALQEAIKRSVLSRRKYLLNLSTEKNIKQTGSLSDQKSLTGKAKRRKH